MQRLAISLHVGAFYPGKVNNILCFMFLHCYIGLLVSPWLAPYATLYLANLPVCVWFYSIVWPSLPVLSSINTKFRLVHLYSVLIICGYGVNLSLGPCWLYLVGALHLSPTVTCSSCAPSKGGPTAADTG